MNAEMELAIESIVEGWYGDRRIDWHDFLDRLEGYGFDCGDSMDSPLVKKIKAHARRCESLL